MFGTPWNTGSVGMDVIILDRQPYPNAFVARERQWFQKLAHWPVSQCTSFCHSPLGMQTVRYFATLLRPNEVGDFLASILLFTEKDLWYQTIVAAQQSPWSTLQKGVKMLQNPMCKRWKQHSRQTFKTPKWEEYIEWKGTTEQLASYLRAKQFSIPISVLDMRAWTTSDIPLAMLGALIAVSRAVWTFQHHLDNIDLRGLTSCYAT